MQQAQPPSGTEKSASSRERLAAQRETEFEAGERALLPRANREPTESRADRRHDGGRSDRELETRARGDRVPLLYARLVPQHAHVHRRDEYGASHGMTEPDASVDEIL